MRGSGLIQKLGAKVAKSISASAANTFKEKLRADPRFAQVLRLYQYYIYDEKQSASPACIDGVSAVRVLLPEEPYFDVVITSAYWISQVVSQHLLAREMIHFIHAICRYQVHRAQRFNRFKRGRDTFQVTNRVLEELKQWAVLITQKPVNSYETVVELTSRAHYLSELCDAKLFRPGNTEHTRIRLFIDLRTILMSNLVPQIKRVLTTANAHRDIERLMESCSSLGDSLTDFLSLVLSDAEQVGFPSTRWRESANNQVFELSTLDTLNAKFTLILLRHGYAVERAVQLIRTGEVHLAFEQERRALASNPFVPSFDTGEYGLSTYIACAQIDSLGDLLLANSHGWYSEHITDRVARRCFVVLWGLAYQIKTLTLYFSLFYRLAVTSGNLVCYGQAKDYLLILLTLQVGLSAKAQENYHALVKNIDARSVEAISAHSQSSPLNRLISQHPAHSRWYTNFMWAKANSESRIVSAAHRTRELAGVIRSHIGSFSREKTERETKLIMTILSKGRAANEERVDSALQLSRARPPVREQEAPIMTSVTQLQRELSHQFNLRGELGVPATSEAIEVTQGLSELLPKLEQMIEKLQEYPRYRKNFLGRFFSVEAAHYSQKQQMVEKLSEVRESLVRLDACAANAKVYFLQKKYSWLQLSLEFFRYLRDKKSQRYYSLTFKLLCDIMALQEQVCDHEELEERLSMRLSRCVA